MDHASFQTAELRCVIGNNAAGPGEHRAGYNGVFSMQSLHLEDSPYVPLYAGFNLEHYFDGRGGSADGDVFFEPRRHPMDFTPVTDKEALLYQRRTPVFGVESWTRFHLTPPYYIDATFTCVPHKRDLVGGFLGVFWASYINAPLDKSIYFLAGGSTPDKPVWTQFCTQQHDRDSTVRHETDGRQLEFESDEVTLFMSLSPLRYAEPFFYGRFRNMVLIYLFRSDHVIRITHSPSGGGRTAVGDDTNPAWDFQVIVPNYEPLREYRLDARVVFKPWAGRADVLDEVRRYLGESSR